MINYVKMCRIEFSIACMRFFICVKNHEMNARPQREVSIE